MKTKFLKMLALILLIVFTINVDATIKCDAGKPGDTVNCAMTESEVSGLTQNIAMDNGLTFISCDVCNDNGNYSISANGTGNFKFKIDSTITESKNLSVTIAGETATIKVNVEVEEEDEESEEVSYTATLIPGNGDANITKSCKVNSLNSTCNVTLDDLDKDGFNGWGNAKDCTEGSKGTIKLNKDVTYYACYKKVENDNSNNNDNDEDDIDDAESNNKDLMLKSLKVMNNDEEISIGFSMRIHDYEVKVPTETESLTIEAVAQNEDVDVKVTGNEELKKDENEIVITLTDKDKNTNKYIIKVIKSDEKALPLLSNLIVGGYDLNFDPEKFVYNLTIDSGIKKLSIEPSLDSDTFEWDIIGNENLKNGSQIKIIVSSEDSDVVSTYIINIEQQSNLMLYIYIGAGVLVILIILLIIVVKKGKKKNKNQSSSNNTNPVNNVAKPVNVQNNIPEVKPAVVTPPTNVVTEKKDDLEILDL